MRSILAGCVACVSFVAIGAAQSPAVNTSDYRLGPDDVINISVYRECPEFCVDRMVIRPDGKISVPLIGELGATGKTALQLQNEITAKLAECCLSEPKVNVIVKEVNSAKVSVLGEVKNSGMYKIGNRTTLLDAIALAGGFTDYAKKDKVTVMRSMHNGYKNTFQFDVNSIIKNPRGDPFYVQPYDTIYVK